MTKFWFSKIKYISKKRAAKELDLTINEFNIMCIYSSIYPVIVQNKKQQLDRADDFYYTIDDIKEVAVSACYKTFKASKKREIKRETFIKEGMVERAKKLKGIQMKLIPIIQRKYNSFGESMCDLGNTLTFLNVAKTHKIQGDYSVLDEFKKFVDENFLLKYAFLSRRGIFSQIDIEDKIVVWKEPYKITDDVDLDLSKKKIEKTEDTQLMYDYANGFVDFEKDATDLGQGNFLENDEKEVVEDKGYYYLFHAIPVLCMHVKLLLHKMKTMDLKSKRKKYFDKMVFEIRNNTVEDKMEQIIMKLGGTVQTEAFENIEKLVVICEDVEIVEEGKVYVQPQYVFDCLNSDKKLDVENYLVGKKLPPHASPFKNVFDEVKPEVLDTLSNTKKNRLFAKIKKLE